MENDIAQTAITPGAAFAALSDITAQFSQAFANLAGEFKRFANEAAEPGKDVDIARLDEICGKFGSRLDAITQKYDPLLKRLEDGAAADADEGAAASRFDEAGDRLEGAGEGCRSLPGNAEEIGAALGSLKQARG